MGSQVTLQWKGKLCKSDESGGTLPNVFGRPTRLPRRRDDCTSPQPPSRGIVLRAFCRAPSEARDLFMKFITNTGFSGSSQKVRTVAPWCCQTLGSIGSYCAPPLTANDSLEIQKQPSNNVCAPTCAGGGMSAEPICGSGIFLAQRAFLLDNWQPWFFSSHHT